MSFPDTPSKFGFIDEHPIQIFDDVLPKDQCGFVLLPSSTSTQPQREQHGQYYPTLPYYQCGSPYGLNFYQQQPQQQQQHPSTGTAVVFPEQRIVPYTGYNSRPNLDLMLAQEYYYAMREPYGLYALILAMNHNLALVALAQANPTLAQANPIGLGYQNFHGYPSMFQLPGGMQNPVSLGSGGGGGGGGAATSPSPSPSSSSGDGPQYGRIRCDGSCRGNGGQCDTCDGSGSKIIQFFYIH